MLIIQGKGAKVFPRSIYAAFIAMVVFAACIAGCTGGQSETKVASLPASAATQQRVIEIAPAPAITGTPRLVPTNTGLVTPATGHQLPATGLADYAFPGSIDATKEYLFYLHGKIIEDQGIPAISPDFGEYEYLAILEKLRGYGFVVISEQRSKGAEGMAYAERVTAQVKTLLEAGVPAKHITVAGASKGGAIAIIVSALLENPEIKFVILAGCNPETLQEFRRDQVRLHGDVRSIYDSKDDLAGSCQELFAASDGLGRYDEIVVEVGTGHGILYKPLDEWVAPLAQWARK